MEIVDYEFNFGWNNSSKLKFIHCGNFVSNAMDYKYNDILNWIADQISKGPIEIVRSMLLRSMFRYKY